MATPTFIQQDDAAATSVTTVTATLTSVAAGNTIVANCARSGVTNRDLTVTDDKGNSYSDAVAEQVHSGGGIEVQISYANNVASGTTVVTLTASGTTALGLDAHEVQDVDDATPVDTGDAAENASGTSHICADSGLIDTTTDVYVSTIIVFSGTTGGGSNPSGYTMHTLGASISWRSGRKTSATALTDENASQTTVTSRTSVGAVASFKGTVVAAFDPATFPHLPVHQVPSKTPFAVGY